MPLRNEFIEIIQIQVAETTGELDKFGKGNTIKREKDIKRKKIEVKNHASEKKKKTTTTKKTTYPKG